MNQRGIRSTSSRPRGTASDGVRAPEQFVSYAQNLEDVMLWRALKSFGPGFYIDVGAGEPAADSVTKAFYDRGWRGINIEPMPEPFMRLAAERPRDINLDMALEAQSGRKAYFSVDGGNGLSTGQAQLAAGYGKTGRDVTQVEVQVETLEHICLEHVTQEILFLKIDVEGSEDLVLRGADFVGFRPWVIVIEQIVADAGGTTKQSREDANSPTSPSWHSRLDGSGYKFLYFDGINRFYVANERLTTLEPYFGCPPNWFDNYITRQEAEAKEHVEELNQGIVHLRGEVADSWQQLYEDSRRIEWLSVQRQKLVTELAASQEQNRQVSETHRAISALQNRIHAIEHSRSWKFMWPLRKLAWTMRRLRGSRA